MAIEVQFSRRKQLRDLLPGVNVVNAARLYVSLKKSSSGKFHVKCISPQLKCFKKLCADF